MPSQPNKPSTNITEENSTITYSKDEISFIDLAIILIKHLKLSIIAFLAFFSITCLSIITTPKQYSVTSVLKIGNIKEDTPISKATEIATLIQQGIIPALLFKTINSETNKPLNINFDIQSTETGNTVKIKSSSSLKNLSTHNSLHQQVLHLVLQQHEQVVQQRINRIQVNIQQTNSELNKSNIPDITFRALLEARIKQQNQIFNTTPSVTLVLAQRSLEPTGISKKSFILLSLFLSLFLSILVAYILEFCLVVKSEINKEHP